MSTEQQDLLELLNMQNSMEECFPSVQQIENTNTNNDFFFFDSNEQINNNDQDIFNIQSPFQVLDHMESTDSNPFSDYISSFLNETQSVTLTNQSAHQSPTPSSPHTNNIPSSINNSFNSDYVEENEPVRPPMFNDYRLRLIQKLHENFPSVFVESVPCDKMNNLSYDPEKKQCSFLECNEKITGYQKNIPTTPTEHTPILPKQQITKKYISKIEQFKKENLTLKCDEQVDSNRKIEKKNKRMKRVNWTKEEDDRLTYLVSRYGYKWSIISPMMINRKQKQCRERYISQLDTTIQKGDWTTEEDLKILLFIYENGKKWTLLHKEMPHRTYNGIKNRWYHYTRCKKAQHNILEDMQEMEEYRKYIHLPIFSKNPTK